MCASTGHHHGMAAMAAAAGRYGPAVYKIIVQRDENNGRALAAFEIFRNFRKGKGSVWLELTGPFLYQTTAAGRMRNKAGKAATA